MKGVEDKLHPRLITEIGHIRRFMSLIALNAYAVNDALMHRSGQYEGTRGHISKRGSASLRKVVYEVIMALKITKLIDDIVDYKF